MKIELGKSYLANIDNKLTEIKIIRITQASNFFVWTPLKSFWISFWDIYKIVVEPI